MTELDLKAEYNREVTNRTIARIETAKIILFHITGTSRYWDPDATIATNRKPEIR
jgi:hypothetical protein